MSVSYLVTKGLAMIDLESDQQIILRIAKFLLGNLYPFYRCKCGAGVPISFFKKLRKRVQICAFRVVPARERKLENRHGK